MVDKSRAGQPAYRIEVWTKASEEDPIIRTYLNGKYKTSTGPASIKFAKHVV